MYKLKHTAKKIITTTGSGGWYNSLNRKFFEFRSAFIFFPKFPIDDGSTLTRFCLTVDISQFSVLAMKNGFFEHFFYVEGRAKLQPIDCHTMGNNFPVVAPITDYLHLLFFYDWLLWYEEEEKNKKKYYKKIALIIISSSSSEKKIIIKKMIEII